MQKRSNKNNSPKNGFEVVKNYSNLNRAIHQALITPFNNNTVILYIHTMIFSISRYSYLKTVY